jgi:thiosulfate/3-mercaptopyruvate sulfurtransferase
MSANGYARPQVLFETNDVAAGLYEPTIRLVEVDVDTSAYEHGHLEGAVGWDWKRDLQRHPIRDIPTLVEWQALLEHSGIANDTRVILCGDNNNWFA